MHGIEVVVLLALKSGADGGQYAAHQYQRTEVKRRSGGKEERNLEAADCAEVGRGALT